MPVGIFESAKKLPQAMQARTCLYLAWLATALTFPLLFLQYTHADTEADKGGEMSVLDPAEWGIRNGCISTQRIRNVDVLDNRTAVLQMLGGKKILMRFRNKCPGIRHNGFVYSSRTGQLCARFDSVRVLNRGNVCLLESFEPFVEVDLPDAEAGEKMPEVVTQGKEPQAKEPQGKERDKEPPDEEPSEKE